MRTFGLPFETISDNPIPAVVIGYVSVQGSESVFDGAARRLHKSAKAYHAKKSDRDSVRRDLEKSGFLILAESALGFSVAAPAGAFEEVTGGTLEARERLTHSVAGTRRYVTHLDIVGENQPAALGVGMARAKSMKVDGIILEKPRVYNAVFPSPIPPSSPKFHLRVPTGVAVALNAVPAHQQGFRGDGVVVAMPDSGWFRHPYFTANGYQARTPITVVPGTDRSKDPVGHGTGESANLFSVAPGATLQAIRASNDGGDLVGAMAAFLKAKEVRPQIMTNSWGGDQPFPPMGPPDESDLAFAAEIQDAVQQGILVVFSAGNGQFSIEPQVPGVLAAGGVYADQNGDLRASDYASGYESPWFEGVVVPTASGLVGLQPRAQYLMLPVPPGCMIDIGESQTTLDDPTTDGTAGNDGWALFSGTSAAAPQIAGAAALLLGAKPGLTPDQVIEALSQTATDVIVGHSFPQRFNSPTGPGPDAATGAGLVNVSAALKYAQDHF